MSDDNSLCLGHLVYLMSACTQYRKQGGPCNRTRLVVDATYASIKALDKCELNLPKAQIQQEHINC